mgnify:CR=1 FL=1
MPDAKTDVELIAEADAAARKIIAEADAAALKNLGEKTTSKVSTDTFDPESYLAANPDVAKDSYFGTRPELHWTRHGKAEGRPGAFGPVTDGLTTAETIFGAGNVTEGEGGYTYTLPTTPATPATPNLGLTIPQVGFYAPPAPPAQMYTGLTGTPQATTAGITGIPLGFSNGGVYQDPTPLTNNLTYGPDTVHDDPDPTDADDNPDTYPTVDNTYGLSVIGGLSTLAGGPLSFITAPIAAYHTISSHFSEEEPQYIGPVNPLTHEIGEIDVTEQQANPQFSQAQVSLAPAQGAESELGGAPPGPPGVSSMGGHSAGTPAEFGGGPGPGGGPGGGGASAPSDAGDDGSGGAPWNIGGFVNTGFQMGGIASLQTGANALQDYARSKLNLSNGIGGYGPVLGSFGQ